MIGGVGNSVLGAEINLDWSGVGGDISGSIENQNGEMNVSWLIAFVRTIRSQP